ncbi:MAG: hypothetical protein HY245_13110 [Rhizobiales bacterium]|nr:hypothetical protein [Hyphomicrobiales bacterium]
MPPPPSPGSPKWGPTRSSARSRSTVSPSHRRRCRRRRLSHRCCPSRSAIPPAAPPKSPPPVRASPNLPPPLLPRPPGNRDQTEAETLTCLPSVLRAIELQSPRLVVSLGKISAQRLTGSADGILRLRGRWRDLSIGGRNVPLLPTLHPAYLLRQPAQKRLAWRDMLMLRQALDAH